VQHIVGGILLVGAVLAVLFGLDVAAEKPAGSDRFAVLIGACGGAAGLATAGLGFILVDELRRVARRRQEAQERIQAALTETLIALDERLAAVEQLRPAETPRRRRTSRDA
jgi:hypothetical protein